MPKPISSDKIAEARRLRIEENKSTPQIARLVGICNYSVYAILRDLGPWQGRSKKSNEYSAEEISALRRLYPLAARLVIEAEIPGRAWVNITKKANALSLKRVATCRYPDTLPQIIRSLREAREKMGMDRRQLARLMDRHPQQLTGWELGLQPPGLVRLVQWADALGFEVALRPKDRAGND